MTGAAGSIPAPPPHPALGRVPVRVAVVVLVLAVAALGFHLGAGAVPAAACAIAAAVLVAGCPVATPLAERALPATARRGAARLGVPLGFTELALLGEVDTLVLPRVGAVTTGVAELRATTAAPGEDRAEVLRLAAAVERPAEHPLAAAVVTAAAEGEEPPDVAEFDALPGRGALGVVADVVGDQVVAHAVLVGSAAFLLEHGIALPAELAAARDEIEREGRTAVAVAWDGVARGLLDVDEPLRPGAAAALALARRAGVRPVVLTGAGPGVAAALAQRLHADPDDVVAEPSPGSGAEVVRLLRAKGALVARAAPGGGAVVDLPVPEGGAAALVGALLLARRARRVRTAVEGLSSATALLGAGAAAAGLLPPILAPAVPAAGAALAATGWLAVAAFGPNAAARAGGGDAVTGRAEPAGATCG
ncbi:HAD family hydrolase [Pseudonocardia humida]|uniref:HAD family hydrolase n=1 Tax=Pseudonocardia humida TaxID=2800819 RepID=A0ABT1A3C5_9PSEU|nr:HAD family hydrolase [Pseudonocardia humida]MCO1657504.1 HAD family hydrolase [Pseudonocardia humida]